NRSSTHGKPRVRADVDGVEGQHDVLARDARRQQLVGHGLVGAVVLNPDLAVLDVKVDDGAVDAPDAVPADVHHLVMVLLGVHDRLRVDLAVGRLIARILLDQAAYDLPVALYSIHRTTLCCCASNTRRWSCSWLTMSCPNRSERMPS